MNRPALLDFDLRTVTVENFTEDVEDLALGHVPDGYRDRLAGVANFLTADESVGWFERNRTDEIVPEVLCDLEGQHNLDTIQRVRRLESVVDRRNRVVGELDVHNGSGHSRDTSDRGLSLGSHFLVLLFCGYFFETRASAPPTISEICWVISD